ncbi:hypothetical protein DFJ58DRAFT_842503 [Suillus subalutaceus]|uniref:uncharacterized protein n=1 Tax=Suillus subalutaceus TaxID=48586 RepID=UPI001B86589A|nr:uncharacterized protein DFJ58DRAFT_842503 [Suillus subalutaceus]KAG1850229.1 hypothetical protein DFJ58DRAFT_842503 [Suillus subalutaceus]
MALCKAASKQVKAKPALSPPQVRTASGREWRPTERENYHLFKSQHVARRQENKENKSDKQKKKALKVAYQDHPDIFEQEPSELHSDIDMEEDMMFSDHSIETKLSNANVLMFSQGKIPPRWRHTDSTHRSAHQPTTTDRNVKGLKAPSRNTHLDDTGNVDESESELDKDDNDNDTMLPTAQGIKRPFDMTSEDAMVLPKMRKNVHGSRQRAKASDFDDISKEILSTACSIFRCLIVTQAPFPDSVAAETKLAKEAWHEVCQMKDVNVKLTPLVVKMYIPGLICVKLLKRTSHVQGELKMKINSMEVVRKNCDLAVSLKDSSVFVFKDWLKKKGIYKTELLQEGINIMWFTNRSDKGVIYHKYFNPIPVRAVALMLMARFDERSAAYKLVDKMCTNLHDTARILTVKLRSFHAGIESLIPLSATSRANIEDEAFKDAIWEFKLEEQDNVEAGSESGELIDELEDGEKH